ncbi:MINPP1 family protein [Megaselia abdita]
MMRRKMLMPTVILVIFLARDVIGLDEYCYATDVDKLQTLRYGTKTAYVVAKGVMEPKDYQVPNCSPTKMWHMSRHGTRLPTKNNILKMSQLGDVRDEIVANYKVRRSQPTSGGLCLDDLNQLQTWKWNNSITPDHAEDLTFQGYEDLFYMAKNYQRIFPNIYPSTYNEQDFLFRYTNTDRTYDSYVGYINGLFGKGSENYVKDQKPIGNDTLLKPYNYCPLWIEYNKGIDNPKNNTDSESYKFEHSQWMKNMIEEVSERLGFKYTLEAELVNTMYDMCRFEQAWYVSQPSVWCAAFTPEHIKVLEYNEDIKYYYKAGYGNPLNQNQPCHAMKDMLKFLENEQSPKAVAYFTHSVMIQMFVSSLGINKDSSMKANDYPNTNRNWRISKSGPFAANIAAVSYTCPNEVEQKKVIFFLNQKPVELEGCKVGLCDWSVVTKKYGKYQNADCDKLYCSGGSGIIFSYFLMVISILTLLFNRV